MSTPTDDEKPVTDRPKFADYVNGPEGWTGDLVEVAGDAWKACTTAYEPIIAGLEKQLAEARAEVAGAYLAVAKAMRCKCAPDCQMINPVIGPDTIIALTPEHARQAVEQRIAEAVSRESDAWADVIVRSLTSAPSLKLSKWMTERVRANRAKAERNT